MAAKQDAKLKKLIAAARQARQAMLPLEDDQPVFKKALDALERALRAYETSEDK